ncbi:MAG: F0F1-type ATP synthase assembly protein I, partial [Planctomycetota bacterium]
PSRNTNGRSGGDSSQDTPAPRLEREAGRSTRVGAGYGQFAGVGLHFAVTILVFAYGGYRLDLWLDTSPWFLLVGVFVGFAGGLISMIKKISKVSASLGTSGKTASNSGPASDDSPSDDLSDDLSSRPPS